MHNFTEAFFRSRYNQTPITERLMCFSTSEAAKFDVFLSYNIADKDVVRGIYFYLKSKGLKVYLDFVVDKDLNRNVVTVNTAKRIRDRLENSKSLLYAQSPNARMSRWMPWELGVVDGNTHKCMIMPVSIGIETSPMRQEYLQLYPYVQFDEINHRALVYNEISQNWRELVSYIRQ